MMQGWTGSVTLKLEYLSFLDIYYEANCKSQNGYFNLKMDYLTSGFVFVMTAVDWFGSFQIQLMECASPLNNQILLVNTVEEEIGLNAQIGDDDILVINVQNEIQKVQGSNTKSFACRLLGTCPVSMRSNQLIK